MGQPDPASGSKTALSGDSMDAVSAMKCTPQKTITGAFISAAFLLNSSESPTKSPISCTPGRW